MAAYSEITLPLVFAQYRDWYEKGSMEIWKDRVVTSVNSTGYGTIRSVALGATQGLVAYTPGTGLSSFELAAYEATITPIPYRDWFFVPQDMLGGDVTGVFEARAGNMAKTSLYFEQNLLVALLQSNGTDWTGNDFFGSHTYSGHSAQTNVATASQVPSLAVADRTAPTALEMSQILFDVAIYGQKFTSENGTVSTGDATKWTVLCGSAAIYSAVTRAIANELLPTPDGATVDSIAYSLQNGSDGIWNWHPAFVPQLAGGVIGDYDIVFLRQESDNRALIVGEDPIEPRYLGYGSEYDSQNYGAAFIIYKRLAFAYGNWFCAVKATMENGS